MTPGRRPSQPSPRWQRISLTAFREPGRHFFCELHLHPQLTDRGLVIPGLGPQPDQLGPLGLAQRGIRGYPRCRGLSCHLHPLAQSHLMDADVAGDLSNRTAAVDDESYRLLLVLRRKCAACRTHFSLSRKIRAAKPGVHRSGNGSVVRSCPDLTRAVRGICGRAVIRNVAVGISGCEWAARAGHWRAWTRMSKVDGTHLLPAVTASQRSLRESPDHSRRAGNSYPSDGVKKMLELGLALFVDHSR